MSEWKEYRLEEVTSRLSSGKNIKADLISESAQYPVFGGNGLRGFTEEFNFEGDCAIIGRQGAMCGNVRYFSGKAYMTEHAVVCQGNQKADTHYLAYLLPLLKLGRLSGQSAQPGLSVAVIKKQTVNLPPIEDQQKISSILSSLDDKIETNRAINARLEELAAAIFKSWFIDFEPFGGVMPDDWEVNAFDEIVDVIAGGTPKTEIKNYWDGNIPWISVKDFVNELHFVMQTERFITEDGLNHSATHLLNPGDTIISARGTVGALAQIQQPMAFNQSCFGLRSKLDCGEHWLYFLLRNKVHDLKQNAHGSVFDTINRKTLSALSIIKPPIEILYDFHNIVNPLIKEIHTLSKESSHLAALRDTLLPRLMSGELIPE